MQFNNSKWENEIMIDKDLIFQILAFLSHLNFTWIVSLIESLHLPTYLLTDMASSTQLPYFWIWYLSEIISLSVFSYAIFYLSQAYIWFGFSILSLNSYLINQLIFLLLYFLIWHLSETILLSVPYSTILFI